MVGKELTLCKDIRIIFFFTLGRSKKTFRIKKKGFSYFQQLKFVDGNGFRCILVQNIPPRYNQKLRKKNHLMTKRVKNNRIDFLYQNP